MMISPTEVLLASSLSVGILTLAAYIPLSSSPPSHQAISQQGLQLNGLQLNGLQLNGLQLNTHQSNIISNGTTVQGTAQADWIDPETTPALLPTQQYGHLQLHGGQLTIETADRHIEP